jgi:hypothetical protein
MGPGVWLSRATVEAAALDYIAKWAEPLTDAAKAALAALPAPPVPDTTRERRRLQAALDEVPEALDRLADALADGHLTGQAYVGAVARKEADAAKIRDQIAALGDAPTQPPARPKVRGFLKQWPGLSVQARRDVYRLLLAEVRVYPKGTEPRVVVVPHDHLR